MNLKLEEEFCLVDLWAAEAYLTALDAREEKLLNMLDAGIKIHQWLLDETRKVFPEAVKQANYDYDAAKKNIHGMNYGLGPQTMASTDSNYKSSLPLPLSICEWQYHMYHNTFPGIAFRMERIRQQLKDTGQLVSLLGRKKIFFITLNQKVLNQAFAWPSQSVIGELTIHALNKLYYRGKLHELSESDKNPNLPNHLREIPWTLPALNTHDGLAIRCHKGNRSLVRDAVKEAFDVPLSVDRFNVTIPVEIGWGKNFNDIEDVEIIRYK